MDMTESFNSGVEWINHAGAIHWKFASAMFLQTVVLVAVLYLLELCLRRRARPVVRYWIWSLVLLKLMLPVTLYTPFSVSYWLIQEPAVIAEAPSPSIIDDGPTRPSVSADVSSEPPQLPSDNPNFEFSPSVPAGTLGRRAEFRSEPVAVAVESRPRLSAPSGSGCLFSAWCSLAALLGAIVIRRAAKVWQLARRATEAPRELEGPLKVACRALNLSADRIRLRISEEVGCPAICGFWRPTILIPQRLINLLDDEQFELVIAHELSHWKRWDLQINLLQTVLQVIYFYNPAVWMANAVLRRLREEAVDEAVLIAVAATTERYSNTLLDVAAHSLRPVEINVRLIGILESRKALVSRIHRLASVPLPKSARLGLWGFAAVAILAVALLPMAGGRRAVADKPAAGPVAKTVAENQEKTAAPASVLSGRITDENGEPVSDAQIDLIHVATGREQPARTTTNGTYVVDRVWNPGEHRLLISSERCLGLTDWDDCPRVVLDPQKPVVRNFTLKVACQVRVQTLDEEGHPIAGVAFFKAGPTNRHQKRTDVQGWMTIGGLTPGEYAFAAQSDDFAIARLAVKVESPRTIVERKLVLKRGVAVKGTVVCSDGKPADGGCRIVALPSWWDFHSSPRGVLIKNDGTFVLPHIGPGTYNVTVHRPTGGSSLSTSTLLSGDDLSNRQGPLALRTDFPSVGEMAVIRGHFRFVGRRPKRNIWIDATALDGPRAWYSGTDQPRGTFRLGPVPRGRYQLRFDSPEIETKQIDSVTAPADDLEVDIQVRGPIVLRGSVVVTGAKGPEPVRDFLIRVVKLKNLRGTNFTPSEKWQTVYGSRGEFAEEVPGPGIYAVEATADGFATIRSEPINTDQLPKTGIRLTLSKGAVLFGSVVDEEGRPIDGAVVMSLAKSGGQLPISPADIPEGIGVRSVHGRFHFDGLTPGNDTFQVVHPDYALALVRNLEVRSRQQESLTIVLKRGGTVAGHVQDERGRPLAGVSLRFQRYPFTFGGDRYGSRFATAVTDANGYYEVHHLPEERIHILRDQGAGSLGVFHQAVLPLNAQTRTVDFGGRVTVSGQLFVNGLPLATTKLNLTDQDAHGDDFGATTITDSDGSFVFSGIPTGKRYLYFAVRRRSGWDDWNRVRAVDIRAADQNLGRIDHRVGTLTVNVVGAANQPPKDASFDLLYYDPSLVQVHIAARPRGPRAKGTAFVFDNVAPGKYDIAGTAEGKPSINRMIEISPDNLNPTITLEWPRGTASIRGTIDSALRELIGNGWLKLYSQDVRWSVPVPVKEDGGFEIGGIPAGLYSLALVRLGSDTMFPTLLAEISLHDGEIKTLNVRKVSVPQSELSKGVLKIATFTPRGIPLPGAAIRLIGPKGAVKPNMSHAGELWFVAEPGSYQLSVAFLGADTVTRTIEIKPAPENGPRKSQFQQLNLTIGPID
jgi:beta-lactamase regulating signal transducer with metallopeptidase domain/protocatechuate 3,4-dioxygenase beta subunit